MRQLRHQIRRTARRAMTLVELMVVVMITVILLASAVPLMRPALKDAQLRESSRQLNVMCAMAKARAREIDRPAGIQIERAAPGSNAAFEVHMTETPPSYTGDFVDALADLVDEDVFSTASASDTDGFASQVLISKTESTSLYIALDPRRSLANIGDYVQFDNKGPSYQITNITDPGAAFTYYRMLISVPSGVNAPIATSPTVSVTRLGVPYTVFRQPLKSPLNSVQFGGGSVIDLEYSGIGIDPTGTPPGAAFFDARYTSPAGNLNDQPVVIMFEPGGGVSRVYTRYYDNSSGMPVLTYGGQRPNGTIYLLIGKFEQTTLAPVMLTDPPADPNNLQDLSNVWLAIGTLTGNVTTAENLGGNLAAAREIARSAQSMGGN